MHFVTHTSIFKKNFCLVSDEKGLEQCFLIFLWPFPTKLHLKFLITHIAIYGRIPKRQVKIKIGIITKTVSDFLYFWENEGPLEKL